MDSNDRHQAYDKWSLLEMKIEKWDLGEEIQHDTSNFIHSTYTQTHPDITV